MGNPIEALMDEYQIPKTRKNYLNLERFGENPTKLSPEEEGNLPKRFQQPFPTHDEQVGEERKLAAEKEQKKSKGKEKSSLGF